MTEDRNHNDRDIVLLCGHSRSRATKRKFVCLDCGSFWDVESLRGVVAYDESYASNRKHHEKTVGALKVKTLTHWLSASQINVSGKVVCEIGFGGGHCLQYLSSLATKAYGIEISEANLRHAAMLGIPVECLLNFQALPNKLPDKIDVWIFQDCFEHLEYPDDFLRWAISVSSREAIFFIVAPEAFSLSERLLQQFWPHRVSDHKFHWSRKGLTEFFQRRGLQKTLTFSPVKFISVQMVLLHFSHKLRIDTLPRFNGLLARLVFPFNIGEMGIVFVRERGDAS